MGEGSRSSLGGLREGHAWEFREVEDGTAGALRRAWRKGPRIGIGERVGSWGEGRNKLGLWVVKLETVKPEGRGC